MTTRTPGWQIERFEEPQAALVEFLESVEFGDAGLRYRRKSVADMLARLAPSDFFVATNERGIIGAYTLTSTAVVLRDRRVPAVYRGLLAVAAEHRRQGIGRDLVVSALEHVRSTADGQPVVSFGLIESGNRASIDLLLASGAVDIGAVESRLVYRQWPRPSPSLERLDADRTAAYRAELDRANASSVFRLETAADLPLYGLVENGRVRAAARVATTAIDLGRGGPLARFLHRHAYARFRALGKRYNRRDFRYLTIHDPLLTEDSAAFRELIDGLLARYDTHMALLTTDPGSETGERLAASGVLGAFSRTTRQELRVLVSGWNLGEVQRSNALSGPVSGGPVY